jgi:hypothetical protein
MIMEKEERSEERARTLVSYAFVAMPFLYLLLILEIYSFQSFDYPIGDSMPEFTYIMVAVGFICVAVAKPLHNKILNARKKEVHTLKEYNAVFFSTSMIRIAFLVSPSIYGLLIFLMTGSLFIPILLIGMSVTGLIIFFPRQMEKEEKMRQFRFDEIKQ